MHAVIPVLFVVSVEAARHAIGRIADITADRHMESVRVTRWLLAFPSDVPALAPDEALGAAVLRPGDPPGTGPAGLPGAAAGQYGRAWRRKAPVESLMPLRLARYGVPLAETGPAGLAAAGIDPTPPPAPPRPQLPVPAPDPAPEPVAVAPAVPEPAAIEAVPAEPVEPEPQPEPDPRPEPAPVPQAPVADIPAPRREQQQPEAVAPATEPRHRRPLAQPPEEVPEESPFVPDGIDFDEALFTAFNQHVRSYGEPPNPQQLGLYLEDSFRIVDRTTGGALTGRYLRQHMPELLERQRAEEVG